MRRNQAVLVCKNDRRRAKVREQAQTWNGLDYLEVSQDQRELTVYFLNKAPATITQGNVRIGGGRRVTGIQVQHIDLCRMKDDKRDDCLHVWLDKPGDFSTYTLCLVEVDAEGQPVVELDAQGQEQYRPMPGIDPRYACLSFSFKVGCPSDLDCKTQSTCPPAQRDEPELSYLAKDYASFRQLILDRLALIMPDWQERHVPDLGIAMVELLAYVGDHLSYYQDAVANEAYLGTARQRISVRRHARLVDYAMHEGCNARTWVCVETDGDLSVDSDDIYFVTGYNDALRTKDKHVLTQDELDKVPSSQYEVFEPLIEGPAQAIQLYEAHNEIHFYTWGDEECCLPRGATSASLVDGSATPVPPQGTEQSPDQSAAQKGLATEIPSSEGVPATQLHLRPGDVLIFEEAKSPTTGNPADADPGRRHAVRLTHVQKLEDKLTHQPVLEVTWADEDALPFPLCISAIGPPPDCALIADVSVAHGNAILVDHGRRTQDDDPDDARWIVPVQATRRRCEEQGHPGLAEVTPARFRPVLKKGPLTFRQPLPADASVAKLVDQEPRLAVPCITLRSIPPGPGGTRPLFRPADLRDPTALAVRLSQPSKADEDPADAYLRWLLSAETQALLESYDGKESLPGPLRAGLLADLTRLLQDWEARGDLLSSGANDRHYVAEIDNLARANLRFGDGELGQQPEAGAAFVATYRVGNGLAGNVGAAAIYHAAFRRTTLSGGIRGVRNPLPAQGGIAPEPLEQVKLFAPYAFRTELQRAISPDDYAALVMRKFAGQVQRARATLRWTGSWYEALVAVDPLDGAEADASLFDEIKAFLKPYHRIGCDVVVEPARYVPLDIGLKVCVRPDYLAGHVKAALLDLFSNRRLPDGRVGFFHPDALTFGEGILLSKLVALARSVPGVDNVDVMWLQRYREAPQQELAEGILRLGPFEVARLDNDPGSPENGRLELEMAGGR